MGCSFPYGKSYAGSNPASQLTNKEGKMQYPDRKVINRKGVTIDSKGVIRNKEGWVKMCVIDNYGHYYLQADDLDDLMYKIDTEADRLKKTECDEILRIDVRGIFVWDGHLTAVYRAIYRQ